MRGIRHSLTSIVTNKLPLHELLDTIELQRISRHSFRILFSCKLRDISLYMLSNELSSWTSMWKARDSSMSLRKSVCIVRNAVRFNSANGSFLISIGSIGTSGAGTGASYELNRFATFADGSVGFGDLSVVPTLLFAGLYRRQLRSHVSAASFWIFRT